MIGLGKIAIFALGGLVGAAAVQALKSEKIRKSCVEIIGKGMLLQKEAMTMIESAKEAADDIVAEAKAKNEKK